MRTWLSTALGRGAALVVLAFGAAAGCAASGQLHDAGPARPITRPSPQQLWPASLTSAPPSPAPSSPSSPTPIPGITASTDRIEDLDVRAVLTADKDLRPDEQAALSGCTGCEIRPAQYRDLTGDGRTELITAVLTADRTAYLHVYTLRDRQVLPILGLQVLPGFTADTVGADLVVHEPTSQATETSSTYRWNSVRLAFKDRQIEATGPLADIPGCPTPGPAATSPTVRHPQWPGFPGPRPSGVPPEPSAAPTVVPTVVPNDHQLPGQLPAPARTS